jgi:hypothetical protein
MNRTVLGAMALLSACGAAFGQTAGPSSSATPYLTAYPGGPAVNIFSIITTGDSVGGYAMGGIPDGLGAYSNNDGTFTLLCNHEIATSATSQIGAVRAHGGNGGSYVSQWIVNSSTLAVTSGRDLNTSYVTTTNGPGSGTNANTFSRFCSADLASQTAYYNASTGLGTQERIFLNGEEAGANGRAIANVVGQRTGYQLPAFTSGISGSWENFLANPAPQDLTIVNANSDGTANRVYTYVGTKTNSGSVIDRAGLTNGSVYGIQVSVNGTNVASENRDFGFASSGAPVLNGRFSLTAGDSGTTFLRPEDGAWNPANPSEYFFVTTDRLDTASDGGRSYSGVSTAANITNNTSIPGSANQVGRSRLWKMSYDNIANPTAGGSITAVLNGTEGQTMFDNICVVPGTDRHTRLIALEDIGNASHNGKVWLIDATTGTSQIILQHDVARFGDIGILPTGSFTYDKESSGVIDARDTLGLGWFLITVQDHQLISGPSVEGGQLLAFYIPAAIPAPGAFALIGAGGLMLARRRRS